jgi:dihydrofolate reductase
MTTILFIATSLDGYIAGPDDDVSWLFTNEDYGFSECYDSVDALIMGRHTYEVVCKMGKWPYEGKPTVVVTRSTDLSTSTPLTTVHRGKLPELVSALEKKGSKRAWLVGGGALTMAFLKEHLVDEVVVSLHPVLLGKGIPLFPEGFKRTMLSLRGAESFDSGLVKLTYTVMPQFED